MPMPPPAEDESAGDQGVALAECQRLLEAVPAAAASSPAFRRHWPSISASLAALSASLASPAFPPAAPLLAPLAAALRALLSVADARDAPRLGHLHTVSLLSSTAAELAQLAADAHLLASAPAPAPSSSSAGTGAAGSASAEDALISRLRMGSAASRAAALEELASTAASLPAPSAAAAVSAVAALLDSATTVGGDLRERAVAALAALATSDAARPALTQEASTVVPHLCRALESGTGASSAEHACTALLPLMAASTDACAAVAARPRRPISGTHRPPSSSILPPSDSNAKKEKTGTPSTPASCATRPGRCCHYATLLGSAAALQRRRPASGHLHRRRRGAFLRLPHRRPLPAAARRS